jgi:hypothetical protein
MISEPHPDVQRLLERMVARMGDRPIAEEAPTPARLRSIDALLVEPRSPHASKLVQMARAANPSLSIVCESVVAPAPELAELVDFAAVLIKPFTSEQLARALVLDAHANVPLRS